MDLIMKTKNRRVNKNSEQTKERRAANKRNVERTAAFHHGARRTFPAFFAPPRGERNLTLRCASAIHFRSGAALRARHSAVYSCAMAAVVRTSFVAPCVESALPDACFCAAGLPKPSSVLLKTALPTAFAVSFWSCAAAARAALDSAAPLTTACVSARALVHHRALHSIIVRRSFHLTALARSS